MANYQPHTYPQASVVYPSPQYRTESPQRSWATGSGSEPYTPGREHLGRYSQSIPVQQIYQAEGEEQYALPSDKPILVAAPRDSGYGTAGQQSFTPPGYADYGRASVVEEAQYDPHARQPSEQLERESLAETVWDQEGYYDPKHPTYGKYQDDDQETLTPLPLYSPDSAIDTPVLVRPPRAEDYLAQRPQTPSTSDASLQTYVSKFKRLVRKVKELPWSAPERVTADYYPGAAKHSARHLKHRPLLVWRNPDYFAPGYESTDEERSSTTTSSDDGLDAAQMPHVGNPASLNLDEEFEIIPRFVPDDAHPGQSTPAAIPQSQLQPRNSMSSGRAFFYPPGQQLPTQSYPIDQSFSTTVPNTSQGTYYVVIPPAAPAGGQPTFPGGYVPYSQQHLGYHYGEPVHR